jgi:hypothetical protein
VLAEYTKDGFAALPRNANYEIGLVNLSHVADELGDAELAVRVEPLLRPFEEFWLVYPVGVGTLGPNAYALGVCSLLAGDLDQAIADFELALEKCRLMRCRPYEAHASLRLSWALADREPERAAELERHALAIGRELGIPRVLRDAARSPQRHRGG